jgi:DNA polymerase-3 subunit delta'
MALKDVIGHDLAVDILLRSVSRGRVPSAYLFAGESGIGKKFTAVNFAKVINCLAPVNSRESAVLSQKDDADLTEGLQAISRRIDCCDKCASCVKIDAGTHPDFVMVAPEKGEIRVTEIRAVEEALSFRPYEGRNKIVIIDDADTMNQSAANAFLKTLEEPPDESLLILVASHANRLPETIRSRCARINFTPLSLVACERVIMAATQRAAFSGMKRPDIEIELPVMVRLSMGRPGLAISSDIVRERERFISLLDNMIEGHGETWSDREEMERWLDMMLIMLRDMSVLKIGGEHFLMSASGAADGFKGTLLNEDILDIVMQISKIAEIDGMLQAYRKLILLKKRLGFNLNKAVTWNYVSSMMRALKLKIPDKRNRIL